MDEFMFEAMEENMDKAMDLDDTVTSPAEITTEEDEAIEREKVEQIEGALMDIGRMTLQAMETADEEKEVEIE